MMKLPTALASISVLLLAGCGVGEGTGSTPPWADTETPVAPATATDENPPEPIDPFRVRLQTTKGDVVIDVHPEWAPRGARRFRDLVEAGYYEDNRIFRVAPGFVVQFGMHGDPYVHYEWDRQPILDDPVTHSNRRGTVTFATSGPNSRTTQVFINLSDNAQLDSMPGSFAPFGEVVEGMDVVESFNSKYGEEPSKEQQRIAAAGNEFLDAEFPGLDSVVKATIVDADGEDAASEPAAGSNQQEPAEADSGEEAPAEADQAAPENADSP